MPCGAAIYDTYIIEVLNKTLFKIDYSKETNNPASYFFISSDGTLYIAYTNETVNIKELSVEYSIGSFEVLFTERSNFELSNAVFSIASNGMGTKTSTNSVASKLIATNAKVNSIDVENIKVKSITMGSWEFTVDNNNTMTILQTFQ